MPLELEILGPSTNNFFTRSAVSGKITSFSVDVLALIGLVENFTIVATCLNSVKRDTTGEFNCGEILYGDTIDEQKKRWGDDQVVYQIVLSSDGNCMDCEGQNMKLEGKYNDNGVPTYSYSFSYTAGT